MKIDFNAPINTVYGVQVLHEFPDPEKPGEDMEEGLTLRHVVVEALLQNEQGMDAKTKLSRYLLAMRVHESNGFAELSVKEAATTQRLVAKAYPPLVVGQAYPLLEGKPPTE